MLMRLAKAIKRGFRGIGKRGYTLMEVAAVVAVSATLAAVALPVVTDKTNEGKVVAGKQDCQNIGNAIATFYKDTGIWPAFNGTSPTAVTTAVPYTGTVYTYQILRTGSDLTHDPKALAGVTWSAVGGATDALQNHLVVDKPGGSTPNGYRTYGFNWKGPYIDTLADKRDPWGNNYLVYVAGMYTPSSNISGTLVAYVPKIYGWVISAGPNGILETEITKDQPQGDDVGLVLFSFEKPKG